MDKPYKTSDLPLAAFLCVQGLELMACVESGEEGRLFFVFQDSPQRDVWVEDFVSGKALVNPRQYEQKRKHCRRLLAEPVAE